jgi:hypothetical protein
MMNMRPTFITSLFVALAVALTGMAAAPMPAVQPQSIDCPICNPDLSGYTGPLTADEINGLLLALNDEYHAWAVYGQVVTDFGATAPFANIQGSEQTHINALISLFDAYGVPVPQNPWIGQVPSFASVTEACAAGVQAEIANRDLYTRLYETTTRADIERVYQMLQSASEQRHLPAFQACADGTLQPGGGLGAGGAAGQGRGGAQNGYGRGNNGMWDAPGAGRAQPVMPYANPAPGYRGNTPQTAAGQGGNAPWWAGIFNWLFGR